ncbi:hypothetical protein SELMODRAFT_234464 [Selaginella moellendorffii]|uniref:Uncharacterized protein n=1 Tax=Selaginella moellendorffii TaxID=88036 RepID=D8SLI8_SELML|nr:uncharacterized protein LOC9643908 [Selaginella moellendorffii]EFJ14669.1 hypothetical protein SELMODRAFT_234464 [Selaginella moellendorffii]|eukprot:XP_002984159.1 uncharacterized protein LOC9643908 [Selaginella moellendorffii]
MEHFAKAKTVRLRSSHGKYLWAEEDMVGVSQERDSGEMAVWEVEIAESSGEDCGVVRLKSALGCYLTASDEHFLLGMTGKKVLQSARDNQSLESLVEWEPIAAGEVGSFVKLKTRHGNFLRGNGGIPPWRNSVTHDVPVRSATQSWLLWEVEVVESKTQHQHQHHQRSKSSFSATPQLSFKIPKSEGRLIRYAVVWDKSETIPVPCKEWPRFHFHGGNTLADLTTAIKEELGLDPSEEVLVCSRHDASGKIFPLKLGLPPNNAPMSLVIVRSPPPQ